MDHFYDLGGIAVVCVVLKCKHVFLCQNDISPKIEMGLDLLLPLFEVARLLIEYTFLHNVIFLDFLSENRDCGASIANCVLKLSCGTGRCWVSPNH